jgi:hypothetical protein
MLRRNKTLTSGTCPAKRKVALPAAAFGRAAVRLTQVNALQCHDNYDFRQFLQPSRAATGFQPHRPGYRCDA